MGEASGTKSKQQPWYPKQLPATSQRSASQIFGGAVHGLPASEACWRCTGPLAEWLVALRPAMVGSQAVAIPAAPACRDVCQVPCRLFVDVTDVLLYLAEFLFIGHVSPFLSHRDTQKLMCFTVTTTGCSERSSNEHASQQASTSCAVQRC